MCQQHLTLYTWCQCEEDNGQDMCTERQQTDCNGLNLDIVRMHCFCHAHATGKWVSEKKAMKRAKKMQKRLSTGSATSASSIESDTSVPSSGSSSTLSSLSDEKSTTSSSRKLFRWSTKGLRGSFSSSLQRVPPPEVSA